MISATTIGSILTPRVGPRPLAVIGSLVAAGGLLLLTRLDLDSSYAGGVLPGLIIVGFGMGLIFAPAQNAATSGVRHNDAGAASAMLNTAQQIGGSIGTALLSSFAASAATNYLTGRIPGAQTAALAQIHRYHVVFWCSVVFLLVCAAISAVTFRGGPLQVEPDATLVIAH
jgi:MFS family permease